MGYRSDFKLIAKGTSEKIAQLQAYLKQQGSKPDFLNLRDWGYSHATWCVELYKVCTVTALTGEDAGYDVLTIDMQSVKLYGSFDTVIEGLLMYGRVELGIDMGLAQLGDDPTDFHTDDGDSVYVPILRQLGDPAW